MTPDDNETNPEIAPQLPGAPVQLNVSGGPLSRREAMQWVMAAVAAAAMPTDAFGQPTLPPAPPTVAPGQPAPQENAALQPLPTTSKGYGLDAKLAANYQPGHFWPLTFNDAQNKTVETLADIILPDDEFGPAASKLGVPAMLDEWVSAPYPQQQGDRPTILEGLTWIEAESTNRFTKPFSEITVEQQHAICDDICFVKDAKPAFKKAAHFFSRFRSLCAGAYYGTTAGWKAIGYVGNVPLARFDGPPAAVLELLGVTQTVT